MRNLSLILVFQLCTLLQLIAQTTTEQSKSSGHHWHSVSVSGNILPFAEKGNERTIVTELPIGRFQPSISLYKNNPDKWLDLTLLVLRPNLTETAVDTFTTTNLVNGQPELVGFAGEFKTIHAALSLTQGRVLKSKIFGIRTFMEYGLHGGYRTYAYKSDKEILPTAIDFRSKKGYAGVSFAYGIRFIEIAKLNLDLKVQNFYNLVLEKKRDQSGNDAGGVIGTDGVFLIPMLQLRYPLY